MRRLTTLVSAHLLFATLCILPNLASAQVCGPDTWIDDPVAFEHLAVEDFQAFPLGGWSNVTPTDPIVASGAHLWGMVWADSSWCIPGMDSGGSCGGDNVYLASAVDLHIEPQAPSTQIGFRYGTQGNTFSVEITLSDGSVRVFNPDQLNPTPWGGQQVYGFFGYCTGEPGLTIAHVHLSAADGGIDDLRVGNAASTCSPEDGELCADCDFDSLRETIDGLSAPQNKRDQLLHKVDKAQDMLADGKTHQAKQFLGQLIGAAERWRGKGRMSATQADEIIACAEALIAAIDAMDQ